MKQPRKKNRYFDLKSQKMLDKMMKERNCRDSTAKGYMSTIKMYTEFNQMQLYELIDEALKEQDAHIPLRETKLKQRLLDYRNYLMNIPEFSQKTAKTYFSKMLTVYRHFECEIPIIPMAQYKQEYVTTYSDLPTLNNLRQILEVSSVDLRAVICFQASSGSAKAEALQITVRQFFQGVQEYHDVLFNEDEETLEKILNILEHKLAEYELIVPTFYLERIKTKKFYYTFCSPEACKWIVMDLKNRIGKTNVQEFLNSQLFDFTGSLLLTRYQSINDYFNWGNMGKFRFFRSHVLRKWNASNIQMTTEDIDNIQGRAKDVVHQAYIKVKPERLKKTYMEHMWRVCISEDWREQCIVLDPLSKEELGVTTPEERAMKKIMGLFEDKFNMSFNPNTVSDAIPEKPPSIEHIKRTPKPAPTPAPVIANNNATRDYDKLLQYAPLLQQGLITQDEFNQIKADIFNGCV